jgi:hypothetical protein
MLPVLRFVCHAQNTSIVSRCWRAMWRKSKPGRATLYISGRRCKATRSRLFPRMIPIETLSFNLRAIAMTRAKVQNVVVGM